MLSFPHLVVLFIIALVIFGPQKLPELARMLGKATAEFRKMTNDFRYALEDEVRELERQTRIKEEEAAAAKRAAEQPPTAPEGTVTRSASSEAPPVTVDPTAPYADHVPAEFLADHPVANPPAPAPAESAAAAATPEKKASDDNAGV
jgi:sec-independent protein translocase protein TatB